MLSERYRLLYCRAFSAEEGVLFGEPENDEEDGSQRREGDPTNRCDALKLGLATTVGQVLDGAADEAMKFTRRANTTAVGRSTLEHLQTVVRDLASDYFRCAPVDLFTVARLYWRRIDQLLTGPYILKEGRELFVHDELYDWAADAMASIALHAGWLDRAVSAAARGLGRVSPWHPLAVRLHAQAFRGKRGRDAATASRPARVRLTGYGLACPALRLHVLTGSRPGRWPLMR